MYLIINTAENNKISLSLKDGEIFVDQITVDSYLTQAERLLPMIDEILAKNNKRATDLEKIVVANQGDGFTSLRIGVMVANALGYALGVPVESSCDEGVVPHGEFNVVKPIYSREPNINK